MSNRRPKKDESPVGDFDMKTRARSRKSQPKPNVLVYQKTALSRMRELDLPSTSTGAVPKSKQRRRSAGNRSQAESVDLLPMDSDESDDALRDLTAILDKYSEGIATDLPSLRCTNLPKVESEIVEIEQFVNAVLDCSEPDSIDLEELISQYYQDSTSVVDLTKEKKFSSTTAGSVQSGDPRSSSFPTTISTLETPSLPKPDKNEMICSICLDPMLKNITSTLCGHIYHLQCITDAIKQTKMCPNCRTKLTLKKIHPVFF